MRDVAFAYMVSELWKIKKLVHHTQDQPPHDLVTEG